MDHEQHLTVRLQDTAKTSKARALATTAIATIYLNDKAGWQPAQQHAFGKMQKQGQN